MSKGKGTGGKGRGQRSRAPAVEAGDPARAGEAPLPRANPHLEGHDAAEAAFAAAWTSGRLHHAWIIGGPPGIGKATLAFRIARWVLARAPAVPAAAQAAGEGPLFLDPAHPVFRRVAAKGHADLFTIERRESKTTRRLSAVIDVEQVREAKTIAYQTAAEGGFRVIIVDGAERLNPNSANALLKLLEEPPPRFLLLLTVDAPGALLPTIRSRCRRLALAPLARERVAALLARYRPDLPEAERANLVGLAGGSIGRALDLAEIGGAALHAALLRILGALPALDAPALHALGEQLARADPEAGYRSFDAFLDLLRDVLARLVRSAARGKEDAIAEPLPAAEAALAPRLLAQAPLEHWGGLWEKIGRLADEVESLNLDRKQAILSAAEWLKPPAARAAG